MIVKLSDQRDRLIGRITKYLGGGGLFNPELANHDAVRELLIDIRAYLLSQTFWPQGVGKPKRDYSGDWKRRLR